MKTIKDLKDSLRLELEMSSMMSGEQDDKGVAAIMQGFNFGVAATTSIIRKYLEGFGGLNSSQSTLLYNIIDFIGKEEELLEKK